jgi:hypothetical protein
MFDGVGCTHGRLSSCSMKVIERAQGEMFVLRSRLVPTGAALCCDSRYSVVLTLMPRPPEIGFQCRPQSRVGAAQRLSPIGCKTLRVMG